jgi:hypothetical protein
MQVRETYLHIQVVLSRVALSDYDTARHRYHVFPDGPNDTADWHYTSEWYYLKLTTTAR